MEIFIVKLKLENIEMRLASEMPIEEIHNQLNTEKFIKFRMYEYNNNDEIIIATNNILSIRG
jgi:hypothetical protein